ncbi:MAG: hypothetical protein J6R42_02950 [Clostridia bacterium]|nr:hypothetical protein [Clostridia bacterium]
MKTYQKTAWLLALCLMFALVFSLPVWANEEGETADMSTQAPSPSDEENATVSGVVVEYIEKNITEICGILTLISSFVVALLFKKGLLPALSKSLTHLSEQLGHSITKMENDSAALEASTKKSLTEWIESSKPLISKMESMAKWADETALLLTQMEEALSKEQKTMAHAEAVLAAQMDLFYQFFMAVNLPQYQKDILGQTYAALKKQLGQEVTGETP